MSPNYFITYFHFMFRQIIDMNHFSLFLELLYINSSAFSSYAFLIIINY